VDVKFFASETLTFGIPGIIGIRRQPCGTMRLTKHHRVRDPFRMPGETERPETQTPFAGRLPPTPAEKLLSSAGGDPRPFLDCHQSVFNKTVAAQGKPIHGILVCDAGQIQSDRLYQSGLRARLGAAQEGFDFAPHFLNGTEVRGAGRQKEDLGPGLRINERVSSPLCGERLSMITTSPLRRVGHRTRHSSMRSRDSNTTDNSRASPRMDRLSSKRWVFRFQGKQLARCQG
jgi:hypothetical protein